MPRKTEQVKPEVEQKEEEITEFEAGSDQPHPDTPQSVLNEMDVEISDYDEDDDAEAENTIGKLHKRKRGVRTFRMKDPEDSDETLVFLIKHVDPGTSLLLNDIAIITGIVFNRKHRHKKDNLEKALEEGRHEEFLKVRENDLYYENKVFALGIMKRVKGESGEYELVPVFASPEEAGEFLTNRVVRSHLFAAIIGNAKPRREEDPPTDADTFHQETSEQKGKEIEVPKK